MTVYHAPTINTYKSMKQRCTNPNAPDYARYGGIGITVCDRWLISYESFVEDMGYRPSGRTLDRIDSKGPYEKNNCRWATSEEQGKNRKSNVLVTYQGETLTLTEWSKQLGITRETLYARKRRFGLDPEKLFARVRPYEGRPRNRSLYLNEPSWKYLRTSAKDDNKADD